MYFFVFTIGPIYYISNNRPPQLLIVVRHRGVSVLGIASENISADQCSKNGARKEVFSMLSASWRKEAVSISISILINRAMFSGDFEVFYSPLTRGSSCILRQFFLYAVVVC